MEIVIKIMIVFVAVFIADIIWVFYIKYVAMSKAIRASMMAVIVYVLSAIVIVTYISNIWYLLPASIGSYFGTYTAIKFHDYLEERKKEEK
jgi:hypothetical protein